MRGLVPLFIFLGGCAVTGGNDVDRAAKDGSAFLRAAFVEHRYDDAAKQTTLDEGKLRAIVDGVEREMGSVKIAQAMSTAPGIEHDAVYVYYRVQAERASGNVGLLVKGDAKRGYRVDQLHVDAKAAPERWPGRPFVM